MTDEELMVAYQQGNAAAFAQLVARHERPLWNFVRRFVGSAASAEDVLQETFTRVIQASGDWRPRAKFSTWVYTIARNLCTDQARRASHGKTETLCEEEGSGPRQAPRAHAADAEVALLNRQMGGRIEAALADLPLDQREVFLMRELMDLPFAQIALVVGASEPTVKSRMRYALQRLREALQEDCQDGNGPRDRGMEGAP